MHEDRFIPVALIAIGGFLLLKNLGLVPTISFAVIWPIALIGLGLWVLTRSGSNAGRSKTSHATVIDTDGTTIHINDWEVDSPMLVKLLAAIAAIFSVGIVGLVLLGVFTPLLVLFIPLVILILFLKLGVVFIKLLIPFAVLGLPLLLILGLLALIF